MKYLIGALVILALLFLVWWIISRGKQRQLDEQRAEAARIRAGAQERTAALQGQETFAQQSTERADLARREAEERARQAEESAREAQRVEEEARRHQADLERGRLERDAELRRADELDPDVELDKNDPRPLPEDLDDDVRPLDETRVHAPVSAEAPAATSAGTSTGAPADSETVGDVETVGDSEAVGDSETVADSVTTPDSQEQGRTEHGWGTGAAAAGAGAAAAGSAYAATRGNEPDDASARLASGVDYSDNGAEHQEAFGDRDGDADRTGAVHHDAYSTGAADQGAHHHDDEPVTREWTPVDTSREADQATDSVSDGVQGDERAQETTMSDEELFGAKAVPNDVADAGRTSEDRDLRDDESRDGDPRDGDSRDGDSRDDAVADDTTTSGASDGDAEMTIIGDVEDYASTEPLPADEQTPGTSPDPSEASAARDLGGSGDDLAGRESTDLDDSGDRETAESGRTGSHAVDADSLADSAESHSGATTVDEPTTEETWDDETSGGDSDTRDNGSRDSDAGRTGEWGGAASTGAAAGAGGAAATSDSGTSDSDVSDADRSADADRTDNADADRTADAGGDEGDASHWPDGTDRINTTEDGTDEPGTDESGTATGEPRGGDEDQGGQDGAASGGGGSSRRISAMDEIRDGGFGVGSAAPFEDRAQPLDHPVQAYRDTMTYRTPDAEGYDSAEPDVWFYDEDAARRAGFNPSQG